MVFEGRKCTGKHSDIDGGRSRHSYPCELAIAVIYHSPGGPINSQLHFAVIRYSKRDDVQSQITLG